MFLCTYTRHCNPISQNERSVLQTTRHGFQICNRSESGTGREYFNSTVAKPSEKFRLLQEIEDHFLIMSDVLSATHITTVKKPLNTCFLLIIYLYYLFTSTDGIAHYYKHFRQLSDATRMRSVVDLGFCTTLLLRCSINQKWNLIHN